jgi:hypothetical protein
MPSTPIPEKDLTSAPPTLPTQKLSALARFKSFANKFSFKNKHTKWQDEIVFPPPSWFLDDDAINTSIEGASDEPMRLSPSSKAPAQPLDTDTAVEAPEPVSFAMKIRPLIDSLPLPTALTRVITGDNRNTHEFGQVHDEIPKDGRGPPIPASVDARLMQLLSSQRVMNGDAVGMEGDKGTYRQSVWSALERLRPGRIGGEGAEDKAQKGQDKRERDHGGGVMMYSPLEPTANSEVELAESELEYVDPAETHGADEGTRTEKGKEKERIPGPPLTPAAPAYEKVWVPSTTKLSLYTAWWGYRLYLPPPVMATLGSTNVKATARAAMVTTALKWFLDKLPLMMVPPALKPTVILLKRLSPLIGYIGVFIAWSWSRITRYDEGGVYLNSATRYYVTDLVPIITLP